VLSGRRQILTSRRSLSPGSRDPNAASVTSFNGIARAGAAASPGGTDLLDVRSAAKQLGLAEDTLYGKVRRDPSYRAMTIDTGTDRVVFDPRKVKAFIARRVR
jgi:hypothetical protein